MLEKSEPFPIQLEAELIEVQAGFAKVRRTVDARDFVLEINKLSLDDQQWFASLEKEVHAHRSLSLEPAEADPWSRTRVFLQNPRDSIEIFGLEKTNTKLGGMELAMQIPLGTWVKFYVLAEDQSLEAMVRFEGASKWVISSEGHRILLDRDDLGPEIVGITQSRDGILGRQRQSGITAKAINLPCT